MGKENKHLDAQIVHDLAREMAIKLAVESVENKILANAKQGRFSTICAIENVIVNEVTWHLYANHFNYTFLEGGPEKSKTYVKFDWGLE